MGFEIWRAGGSTGSFSAADARAVEAQGWDGQMFMDSQSLSADPYALMGAWAIVTERIKLSTGVTNPLTRHPAVTAAGAATVQMLSGGRAVLGIGRGDSALAYLGHAPVKLAAFERTLHDLQALLSGREIAFNAERRDDAASLESLSLGDRPGTMGLRWLPADLPKVPLDVAATGPRVIEMAAPVAERVTFSVGAIVARMEWALGLAREARTARGLGEEGVSYGAQVVVVCHTDMDVAMELATSYAAPLARFQVIQSEAAGPQNESDAANFAAIRKSYDMNKHGDISAAKRLIGEALTPDFVRRFAIVGPPDHCTARLAELARAGLERFVIAGPGTYPASWGEARTLFAREVLPALRRELAGG